MAATSIELFFDPMCPFCWLTSRWLEDVRGERDLDVTWRPISLAMLNPDEDPASGMGSGHARGLELLRVVEAAYEDHGNDAVGRLYTELGQAIHEQPVEGAEELTDVVAAQADRPDLAAALAAAELPGELASAAHQDRYDAGIRASTDEALTRAGDDVGTPVLTFDPPDGPSFFGPIFSEQPKGTAALEVFDAVRTLAAHASFTELKRSLRDVPDTAAFGALRG